MKKRFSGEEDSPRSHPCGWPSAQEPICETGALLCEIFLFLQYETTAKVIKVTMTFGVAQANESFRIEDFIQQADNRLYYGKTHGKCQVVAEIPNIINS